MKSFTLSRYLFKLSLLPYKLHLANKSIASWIMVISYFLIWITIITGPWFKVGQISCKYQGHPNCPDFVLSELTKYLSRYIFYLPTSSIAESIKHNLPYAQDVKINKIWPNQLTVHITSKPIIAYFTTPAKTPTYTISNDGQILGVEPTSYRNLPVIIASSAANLAIGDYLNQPSLILAVKTINEIEDINEIQIIDPLDIRARLKTGFWGILTSNKPLDTQLYLLKLILTHTRINPSLSYIDLRYDRPTLKSNP